ncbi:MAG: hypothetical protein J6S14_12285 [Clostridia bacterium]|nr:hypothetical protein [Clostridia bacterium]
MNFEAVPANILRHMRMLDISMKQMAASLGMSERNLYRRFQKPGDFTLEEVKKVCNECELSLIELLGGI